MDELRHGLGQMPEEIVLWLAVALAGLGVLLAIAGVVFDVHRWRRRRMHRRNVKDVTVEEVWVSDAGARLFNGISRMDLLDSNGYPILFSRRRAITDEVIAMLLDRGYVPRDLTPRVQRKEPDRAK